MNITVVVPTYKRTDSLEKCLQGLVRQTRSPDEVLVIVRDSDSETWDFIKRTEIEEDWRDLKFDYISVDVPGQVNALNTGLDRASGQIVAFTDDDAIPRVDWLERIEVHYTRNPDIAGVGGRDWIHVGTQLEDGSAETVGKLKWFGRVIPNHHLGVGAVREVDWLKGANMSFRKEAITGIRFNKRLKGKGAQGRNDLNFCLQIKKKGMKLVYDPLVAVDHYPGKQFDDDRRSGFIPSTYYNECYNEALTILEFLPALSKPIYFSWAMLIGTRSRFGVAQCLRFLAEERSLVWDKLLISFTAFWEALKTSSC